MLITPVNKTLKGKIQKGVKALAFNLMYRKFNVALCHFHETCPRPRSGNGNLIVLVMIILDSRSTDCLPE